MASTAQPNLKHVPGTTNNSAWKNILSFNYINIFLLHWLWLGSKFDTYLLLMWFGWRKKNSECILNFQAQMSQGHVLPKSSLFLKFLKISLNFFPDISLSTRIEPKKYIIFVKMLHFNVRKAKKAIFVPGTCFFWHYHFWGLNIK